MIMGCVSNGNLSIVILGEENVMQNLKDTNSAEINVIGVLIFNFNEFFKQVIFSKIQAVSKFSSF